ncbi:MAG TPA: hypothetical protein VFL93_14165 [Longimicrobiaceae bacterium]|nr:hypothetical protein [Longimicrobiaceae bacterium]
MDTLLRRYVEWKAKRRAAQVIVFDGGAEVERTRAFLRGAFAGILLTLGVFVLTAPTATGDGAAIAEVQRRTVLLRDANRRAEQAANLADVCLTTARHLEETLDSYESLLKKGRGQDSGFGIQGKRLP